MSTRYRPPLASYDFIMRRVVDVASVLERSGQDLDDVREILSEAGRVGTDVLDPLNRVGDRQGVNVRDGVVMTPEGSDKAFRAVASGGWMGVSQSPDIGGGGLPHSIVSALDEIWSASNLAFSLVPLLTAGAMRAIEAGADEHLRSTFLPPMVEGRWTGTLNLSEPNAGSDLSAITSTASPGEDGSWSLTGQKIFISWGDHELSENIVHLVLARTTDAPPGLRGLSMFIVPKFLPEGSGVGQRNAVTCLAVERKMGLHGSPTCVMAYDGAAAYLVGERHRGLEAIFVMMNAARIEAGVQGLGVADRAYQQAREYAAIRVQGAVRDRPSGAPINEHPDVRRLLLSMASSVSGTRALSVQVGTWADEANWSDGDRAEQSSVLFEFFVPIFKAWATEQSLLVTSDALQVHGGTGFVEETGAAQFFRDARILTIYEGTTAIQSNDLLGRKIVRDHGATAQLVLEMIRESTADVRVLGDQAAAFADKLAAAVDALDRATHAVLRRGGVTRDDAASSVAYLLMWGAVSVAWMHARMALAGHGSADEEETMRHATAFAVLHLSAVHGLGEQVQFGEVD